MAPKYKSALTLLAVVLCLLKAEQRHPAADMVLQPRTSRNKKHASGAVIKCVCEIGND